MKLTRPKSIRQKLVLVSSLASAMAIMVAVGVLLFNEGRSFQELMVSEAASRARIIAQACTSPLDFDDKKLAREILESFRKDPHVAYAAIYQKSSLAGPTNAPAYVDYQRDPLQPVPRRDHPGYIWTVEPIEQAGPAVAGRPGKRPAESTPCQGLETPVRRRQPPSGRQQ